MQLLEIEQLFYKHSPKWIEQYHKIVYDGEKMTNEYYNKLFLIDKCFVGEVRKSLGLPKDYAIKYNDDFCYICKAFAFEPFVDYSKNREPKYIKNLEMFKNHLENDHGVKLNSPES
jgi:hypothetical protein